MASTMNLLLLIVVVFFAHGGDLLQYHDDGDDLWTFLKQNVDSIKEDNLEDEGAHQMAKENDEVYDDVKSDVLETRKLHAKKEKSVKQMTEDVSKKEKSVKQMTEDVSILMPGVRPRKMDTYLCTGHELPENTTYVVAYKPEAEMNIAHHMLMFGCENLPSKKKKWECGMMGSPCGDGTQSIMYAWGRDAPPLKMDPDVGMKVGGDTGFNFLVLQVHYLNVSTFKNPAHKDYSGIRVTLDERKKNKLAAIYFLGAGWPPIPPHKKEFFLNMGCEYGNGATFHPFRYRVHAHSLGRVVTAYRIRNGVWSLIGRRDPLKPQAFYEIADKTMDIKPGDTLMGRCTYNSMGRNRTTYIGATHSDEMCNFYLMYYYDSTTPESIGGCGTPKAKYYEEYPSEHVVV